MAYNVFQAGVSFLLVQVMHLSANAQKITLAWCYNSLPPHRCVSLTCPQTLIGRIFGKEVFVQRKYQLNFTYDFVTLFFCDVTNIAKKMERLVAIVITKKVQKSGLNTVSLQ